MKVGILGGTFDPPHNGHLLIASEIYDQLQLEEVWFMPNQIPPHKQETNFTNSQHRLNMLMLALKGHSHFKVEPIELNREGPSYTYDTIVLLKEKFPDVSFYFIIGADMIEFLPQWYKIDELVELITFVGVGRPGFQVTTKYPVKIVNVPEFDVSSTLIRSRIKNNHSVDYLLPEDVKIYIEENHLYGS